MALTNQGASAATVEKLLLANTICWGSSAALFLYEAVVKENGCQKVDLPAICLQVGPYIIHPSSSILSSLSLLSSSASLLPLVTHRSKSEDVGQAGAATTGPGPAGRPR